MKEVMQMSMFSNLNKSYENKFVHMPEVLEKYLKLSQLNQNEIYTVLGMYIVPANKSKFGEHANMVLVDNNGEPFIINLPHHMTDSVKMIMSDDRLIEGVNNGDCKVKVKDYFTKKYNKNCRTLEYC